MTTTAEKLRAAKALIEDPERWCRGDDAQDATGNTTLPNGPDAVKWCARGACERADGEWGEAMDFLYKAAKPLGVAKVNDNQGHGAVLDLFDRAIELAEREEAK